MFNNTIAPAYIFENALWISFEGKAPGIFLKWLDLLFLNCKTARIKVNAVPFDKPDVIRVEITEVDHPEFTIEKAMKFIFKELDIKIKIT